MRIIAETTCSKKCKRSVAAILSNFQSCWNIVVLGVKLKVLRQGNHCNNYFWNSQNVLGEWSYIFKLVANFSNCIPDIVKIYASLETCLVTVIFGINILKILISPIVFVILQFCTTFQAYRDFYHRVTIPILYHDIKANFPKQYLLKYFNII